MENNVIDLKKIEEETKEKVKAVNFQKTTIVAAFIDQMKVWKIKNLNQNLSINPLHLF